VGFNFLEADFWPVGLSVRLALARYPGAFKEDRFIGKTVSHFEHDTPEPWTRVVDTLNPLVHETVALGQDSVAL